MATLLFLTDSFERQNGLFALQNYYGHNYGESVNER